MKVDITLRKQLALKIFELCRATVSVGGVPSNRQDSWASN